MPPADWAAALRASAASRVAVVRGDVLLLRVAAAFHPLLALLPHSLGASDVVLVLRLHTRVAALLQQVADSEQRQALLESLVFEECAAAAVGALSAARGQQLTLATPLFCERVVATSGVLRAFAADEAGAKAALADVARALQTCEDAPALLPAADGALVVAVEHDAGYAGLQFRGRVVASAIRVETAPFAMAAAGGGVGDDATTLDSVLEAYEGAFRDQMELRSVEEQPQRLEVSVRAGFAVSSAHRPSAATAATRGSAPLGAMLLSSWGGIENVRALQCAPPPSSSSLLCIGALESCGVDALRCASTAGVSTNRSAAFPRQLQETVAFLARLGNFADDDVVKESGDGARMDDVEMEDVDPAQLEREFRRFLSAPDATLDDAVDLNSTLELNIALAFESAEDLATKSRSDLDFLEKMWDFALRNARTTDAAAALVRECVATFAAARTIPFVHPSNDTRLGELLKMRAAASSSAASEANDALLRDLQTRLSSRQHALGALVELGEWKMRRDVAAWFVQIGFTAAESSRILEQFERQDADSAAPPSRTHAAMQQLVDVCAMAHSLGTSGSLLRKLVNDFLGRFARHNGHEAETDTPPFVLPLSSFIPERTRANLGDALFWDVEMSLGELMERTEVLLHPEVLAFMQEAEKAFADTLPLPTGLVQLTCTVRSLML